jgi:hypothetical protein
MSTLVMAVALALALAFQGPLCTPMCADSTETGSSHAAVAETSGSSLPCHETADAGSAESSGTSGCGHDCEGCGLLAASLSGTSKPVVPPAPAPLFSFLPGVRVDAPQPLRIEVRRHLRVHKRPLSILHSTLLL